MTAALIEYSTQTYTYAHIRSPAVCLGSLGNGTCSLRIPTHTARRPVAAQRRLIRQSCQRSVTIPLATPQGKRERGSGEEKEEEP